MTVEAREIPMPKCNVDGCEDRAIAKLIGEDAYQKAYRCRSCLCTDLGLRAASIGGTDK